MLGWQCQDPAQTGKLSGIPCIGFPSLRPFALGKGLESRSNGGSRSGSGTAPVGGNHLVMPGGELRRARPRSIFATGRSLFIPKRIRLDRSVCVDRQGGGEAESARSDHRRRAMETLRYSITFRNLREDTAPVVGFLYACSRG
jgi:hypothetical protein